MKVYIGPYKHYYSVYGLLESIPFLRERHIDAILDSWFGGVLASIFDYGNMLLVKDRTVKVRIDKYDTWNMDHTLSKIIYPMLVQLKNEGSTIGIVKNEDVPEELRLADEDNAWANTQEHEEILAKRWNYVLDEMIWAFKEIAEDYPALSLENQDEAKNHNERCSKGTLLFGKYYSQLWS